MTTDGYLDIVYEDDLLVAINKPHGLLIHRTPMAKDAKVFALQMLRDQIGLKVYPTHRLDRKTSGVLLFAKNPETNSNIQKLFRERKVAKTYIAIVRGYSDPSGIIDYPLRSPSDKLQEASTTYTTVKHWEIPYPSSGFPTSRYSLVNLKPQTGRYHQLRKHMAHIFHPIIGDRPHGCNKQNRIWKHQFHMDKMCLHAATLEFNFVEGNQIGITAEMSPEMKEAISMLDGMDIARKKEIK